ncbi:hypothetical protein RJ55_06123 [Drechmeria coniospora]|nr:hypothetical protein RJ55_06123 [Drechmeria coniospora]
MSQPYLDQNPDIPARAPGSVKRARERAEAGLSPGGRPLRQAQMNVDSSAREYTGPIRPRPTPDPPLPTPAPARYKQAKNKTQHPLETRNISRPMRIPQWPLPGSPASAKPPTRLSAPQRPPRPSHVPSLLDQSKVQSPGLYVAHQNDLESSPESPTERAGLPVEDSPVVPAAFPVPQPINPRRSTVLGPPPSSRRGDSSFYSRTSYVSPIIEESPRTGPYGSLASSAAATPEVWRPGTGNSIRAVPSADHPTERYSLTDENQHKAQFSASRSAADDHADFRPSPLQMQPVFFTRGEAGNDTPTTMHRLSAGPETLIAAPRLPDSHANQASHMRQPLTIDIDAVRKAESRGSLTSLPELIRRATRLASMIDRGSRPASRTDELFFDEKGATVERDVSVSDMLAAFPPPVHTSPQEKRQSRISWHHRAGSWHSIPDEQARESARPRSKKRATRCCGLPLWAFILIVFILLCLIVIAIVVPLELLVFKNAGNNDADNPNQSIADCQKSLRCLNGGTSVFSQGACSCICTNGFTGPDCNAAGNAGCTTTNLVASDASAGINNVTLGQAIPRLIVEGNSNYAIPLSSTAILAKFSAGNLSCVAQNSLVTFNGHATVSGQAGDQVSDTSNGQVKAALMQQLEENFPPVYIITYTPALTPVDFFPNSVAPPPAIPSPPASSSNTPRPALIVPTIDSSSSILTTSSTTKRSSSTTPPATTSLPPRTTTTLSSLPTTTSVDPASMKLFTVTEAAVDFSRVAMLYILQEKGADAANLAQSELQRFFTKASSTQFSNKATEKDASRVGVGGENTVDLIAFTVNVGKGPVGKKKAKRAVEE